MTRKIKSKFGGAMASFKQINWPSIVIAVFSMFVTAFIGYYKTTSDFNQRLAVQDNKIENLAREFQENKADVKMNFKEISGKLDELNGYMINKTKQDEVKSKVDSILLMMGGLQTKNLSRKSE